MDSVTIATSVFGAITAGFGAGSNVAFLRFQSSTLGKSVMLMNTGMEAIDGMIFAMDSWSTVLDIIKGRISDDEALVRLVQIITSLAINGALLMMPSAQRWRAKKMAPNTKGLPKEDMDMVIELTDQELKAFNKSLENLDFKNAVANNPRMVRIWKTQHKIGLKLEADQKVLDQLAAPFKTNGLAEEDALKLANLTKQIGLHSIDAPLSPEAAAHISNANALLSKKDVINSITELDALRSKVPGATEKQFADLEAKLAELNGTTNPEVYRRPTLTIGGSQNINPSIYPASVPVYHGTNVEFMTAELQHRGINVEGLSQEDIVNEIFKYGLSARGNNIDLNEHVLGAEDTALRGTTTFPGNQDVGAVYWAIDRLQGNGIVFEIDGVHGWDTNQLLQGKIRKEDGSFGGNIYGEEQEFSILAQVPNERIKGAYFVKTLGSGNSVAANFIKNNNYKPLD